MNPSSAPTPRPRLSSRKKLLFAAVLALAGLLAGVGLAGVALALGWVRPPVWLAGRVQAWRASAQRQRPRRILITGDSFLSWWPLRHCLSLDLQAYCDARRIGLLNTAVGGYGPREYDERVHALLPTFKPDLVLMFYYVGNDLSDVMDRTDERPRSLPQPTPTATTTPPPPPAQTALWDALAPAARAAAPQGDPAARPTPVGADQQQFDWDGFLKHGIDPQIVQYAKNRLSEPDKDKVAPDLVNPFTLVEAMAQPRYLVENVLIDSDRDRSGWLKVQRVMLDAFVAARAAGAEVCLVVIPATVQVSRSHYDFYRRCTFVVDDRMLSSARPQELLRATCAEARVTMVDLLPAFRAAGGELYWENDEHLNQDGHELAMKTLREQFLDAWCAAHPAAASAPAVAASAPASR